MKTYRPKKTLKQKRLEKGAHRLRGARWVEKCPGCKGKVFTATEDQLMKGSCFVMTNLRCVACGDGMSYEGFVAAGSHTGNKLKLTMRDEIRDRVQAFRHFVRRALQHDKSLLRAIEGLDAKGLKKAKRWPLSGFTTFED